MREAKKMLAKERQEQQERGDINPPTLAGASLQVAFDSFLDAYFSNRELASIANGARVLTNDACCTLALIDSKHGEIVRVGDGDVAGSIEEERAEILIYRPFWDLFRSGKWIAEGRLNSVAAPLQRIEASFWDYITAVNLTRGVATEDVGGARFIDIRIYSAEALASSAVVRPAGAGDEIDGLGEPTAAVDAKVRGRPPKYAFSNCFDQLLKWSRQTQSPTRGGLAGQLARIDYMERNSGREPPGDYDLESATRAATEFLKLEYRGWWNSFLKQNKAL